MPPPTALALARLFTSLINRPVTFTRVIKDNGSSGEDLYGVYKAHPSETYVVVQADLALFGCFAGSLLGLQDADVENRIAAPKLDEIMSDAITEVFNVASSAFAGEGRTVFTGFFNDPASVPPEVKPVIQKPSNKLVFDVSINSGQCQGRFALLLA